MARLKKSSFLVVITMAGLMFGYMTNTFAEKKTEVQKSRKMITQMEQHWLKVVKEKNPLERKKLIEAHKKMMDEIDQSMGVNRHHHMHGQNRHHDLMNTMDMHKHMMRMMD